MITSFQKKKVCCHDMADLLWGWKRINMAPQDNSWSSWGRAYDADNISRLVKGLFGNPASLLALSDDSWNWLPFPLVKFQNMVFVSSGAKEPSPLFCTGSIISIYTVADTEELAGMSRGRVHGLEKAGSEVTTDFGPILIPGIPLI